MSATTPRITQEIQALREALAAERKLGAQLSDHLRLVSWTSTPDGRAERLSRFWYEFTGLPEDGPVSDFVKAVHPEDLARLEHTFAESLRKGSEWTAEYRLRHRDGSYRWFLGRSAPVRERGRVLRWVGVAFEIDEQVRLRDELAAREESYGLLVRAARENIWELDLDGRRMAWSDPLFSAFGWGEKDRLPPLEAWGRRVHPSDLPRVSRGLRKAVDEGARSWEDQYRFRRKDGSYAEVLDRCFIARGRKGEARRLVGALQDVSEQRRAAAALKAEEDENRLILDSVRAMILYKDGHGRVVRCNLAAAEWFGRRPEELAGARLEELFPKEAGSFLKLEREVAAAGRPSLGVMEELVSPATGERRWLRTDRLPRPDPSGRPAGLIVFRVDVTDIKRAEEVTRESEERQRSFVANVSHELRTPVAAIKGFAETLRRGALREPRSRMRFVRIIESHADRLAWIVEDLMTLSNLDAGRPLDLRPVSLAREVEEYLESVSSLSRARGVKLSSRVPRSLRAMADRPHLLQALENLVGNALKYTPAGGSVRVEGRARGEWARLTVRDTGVGIPKEHLERVFDRFFRVERSRKDGSGLGLHIVRKIASVHGGRVWAESRPGKGSAFHLELPRAPVTPS